MNEKGNETNNAFGNAIGYYYWNGSNYLFTSKEDFCNYLLTLRNFSTLNGKIDLVVYLILGILVLFTNIALIYGMLKTKDTKTNTSK